MFRIKIQGYTFLCRCSVPPRHLLKNKNCGIFKKENFNWMSCKTEHNKKNKIQEKKMLRKMQSQAQDPWKVSFSI